MLNQRARQGGGASGSIAKISRNDSPPACMTQLWVPIVSCLPPRGVSTPSNSCNACTPDCNEAAPMPILSVLLFIKHSPSRWQSRRRRSQKSGKQRRPPSKRRRQSDQYCYETQLVRFGCGPSLNLTTARKACGQCGFDMGWHEGRDIAIECRNLFHKP